MPVVGGILADRLMGFHKAIISGAVLMIIGNSILFLPNPTYMYLGLAISTCGIGLYKVSCTSMVGDLHPNNNLQRARSFTIFYVGMNIGAILGPLVYAAVSITWGLKYAFLGNAIGILLGLIALLIFFNHSSYKLKANLIAYPLIAIICLAIYFLLLSADLFSNLIELLPIMVLLAIIPLVIKYPKSERNKIIALLILIFFFMFFFVASLQIGSSIIMFINRDINRIILGWQIPAAAFNALDPLFVVLTAPIFVILWKFLARKHKEPSVAIKLVIGLFLASLSLVCFTLATINQYALTWILVAYLLLGAGEICLAPAMLTAISRHAPKNIYATMMGISFLAVAFAGFFSSMLAKVSSQLPKLTRIASLHIYAHTFLLIAVIIAIVAIILLIISPFITFMLKDY